MLTIEEAATRLRVTQETVRRQLRTGRLEGAKVGAKWLIKPETVEQLLLPTNTTPKHQVEALWREMTSGDATRHNAALKALFASPDDVQAEVMKRSAKAASAYYATPEGQAELADWRALDGEPFQDDEGDYYSDEEEAQFRAERAAQAAQPEAEVCTS